MIALKVKSAVVYIGIGMGVICLVVIVFTILKSRKKKEGS